MSRIFFTKCGAKIAAEIEIREWDIAKVNATSVNETPLFQGLHHKYIERSVQYRDICFDFVPVQVICQAKFHPVNLDNFFYKIYFTAN